ncbi:MAG: hypothetical protein IJQ43_03805 [Oscillospiraceae bacterium]|nr:hypothetical protein [Oscillospiraceae bacterium]
MKIDVSRLRDDLEDYYGTAMFSGMPMAVIELSQAETASPQELVDMARRAGFDLGRYEA